MEDKMFLFKPNSKVTTVIIAVAHFVIIAVGFFTFLSYQRTTEDLVLQQDRQLAFLSAIRLKSELDKFLAELENAARDPALISNNTLDQREAFDSYEERLSVFDGGVYLLDENGIVADALPADRTINRADWSEFDFFTEQLIEQRSYISNTFSFLDSDMKFVAFSIPLSSHLNEFRGVLVGLFKLGNPNVSSFYASIVRLRIGNSGSTFLLDRDHLILYASNQSHIEAGSDASSNILEFEEEYGAYRTVGDERKKIVIAYSEIPQTDWTLVFEEDWELLTAHVRPYQNLILGFLGTGMVLPAVSVLILSRIRNKEEERIGFRQREKRHAEAVLQSVSIAEDKLPLVKGMVFALGSKSHHAEYAHFKDVFVSENGETYFVLATINQIGIRETVVLSQVKSFIREKIKSGFYPSETLNGLNKHFFPEFTQGQHLFVSILMVDPGRGNAVYSYAGYPNIYSDCPLPFDSSKKQSPIGVDLQEKYLDHMFDISEGCSLIIYQVLEEQEQDLGYPPLNLLDYGSEKTTGKIDTEPAGDVEQLFSYQQTSWIYIRKQTETDD